MYNQIYAHTSFVGETGYSNHSRNFFTALNKLLPVKIRNFSVGSTWDGLINDPHGNERYIANEHKDMLIVQTTMDGKNNRTDYDIYKGRKSLEKEYANIVLNETEHYYFYDIYEGTKIAYNVWESTRYPDAFFQQLMKFDYLWVPTKWQKKCAIEQGYPENRIYVVPEAVDESIFFPENIDLIEEYKDDRFKFLIFGRWDYRKSTTEMIQAFLETFSTKEKVDLIISVDNKFAADGITSTEERLKKFGLEDKRIKIKHFPSREEYIKYLKIGHVLLSCARSEGWGLPLCEAMACGIPSIYSNWGAQLEYAQNKGFPVKIIGERSSNLGNNNFTQEHLGNNTGNFCEPDFEDLKKVMRFTYENYDFCKEKSLKESKIIRKEFTWERVAEKAYSYISEIYERHDINNKNQSPEFIELSFLEREENGRIFPKIEFSVLSKDIEGEVSIRIHEIESGFLLHREKMNLICGVSYWIEIYRETKSIKGLIVEMVKSNKVVYRGELKYNNRENVGSSEHIVEIDGKKIVGKGQIFDTIKQEYDRKVYLKYFDINENDIVVDIGSHVGFFTFLCHEKKIKKCYLIEPDNRNIQYLKKNLNYWDIGEYEIIEKAVDDVSGEQPYLIDEMGITVKDIIETDTNVMIPTISFMDFINQYQIDHINFLKMDCEGGEYCVINNKENWEYISKNVDKMVGELHSIRDNSDYSKTESFLYNLENMGFETIIESCDGINITDSFKNSMEQYSEVLFYATNKRDVDHKEKKLKLNLGCGDSLKEGHVNIDLYCPLADICGDVRNLEYKDDCVDEIFSSHTLEHFSKNEIPSILKEWYRVLKKEGKIILNLPDLEWCVINWLNCYESDKWGYPIDTIFGNQNTEGEYHKTGFTYDRIKFLLTEAGFINISIENIESHGQRCFLINAEK